MDFETGQSQKYGGEGETEFSFNSLSPSDLGDSMHFIGAITQTET